MEARAATSRAVRPSAPAETASSLSRPLTRELARRVGGSLGALHRLRRVVVGRGRGPNHRAEGLIEGLLAAGVDVVDLGSCAAEVSAFALLHLTDAELDASLHLGSQADPTLGTGLRITLPAAQWPAGADPDVLLHQAALEDVLALGARRGKRDRQDLTEPYVEYLLSRVDVEDLSGLTLVANASRGEAWPLLDRLVERLPARLIPIERDEETPGPQRTRHPWHPEDRVVTTVAVRRTGADLGAAFDADAERVVFFDEQGEVVRGGYALSLLAVDALQRHAGGAVAHCPRVTWGPDAAIERAGGRALRCATGPAALRAALKSSDDVRYAGEASGAHWFRDAVDAPTGLLAWLRMGALLGRQRRRLSRLVGDLWQEHPTSGEVSRTLADPARALDFLKLRYGPEADATCTLDGLGLELDGWRLHARPSRTASMLRLHLETHLDPARLMRQTDELLALIDQA